MHDCLLNNLIFGENFTLFKFGLKIPWTDALLFPVIGPDACLCKNEKRNNEQLKVTINISLRRYM